MRVMPLNLVIVLFLLTIFQKIRVGWLLFYSLAVFMYTLIILLSKTKALTKFGVYLSVLSMLGIIYCLCVLTGVDIAAMFEEVRI